MNKTQLFHVAFQATSGSSSEAYDTRCRVAAGHGAEERALRRAVEKLFGKKCWWNMQVKDTAGAGGAGQVFEGSRARTGRIGVAVTEV